MVFGLCCIVDGLVRVLSLGFLHSRVTLNYSRYSAGLAIRKMKKR